MKPWLGLTKRNLQVYFKDIQSVLFSMLTPLIVFVLYLLFLKGTFLSAIQSAMMGMEQMVGSKSVDLFCNGLLLSGILGTACITVSYSTLSTIVRDRENKIDYDILATPIKRVEIIFSYFVSSALSAFLMNTVILAIGVGILSFQGGLLLSATDLLSLLGITLLGSVSATALFMVVILFFKTTSSSSAFFGLLSAAVGFVIGAYIPLSQFSRPIQTVCNLFPGTGVTVLYRNALLSPLLAKMDQTLGGVDGGVFAKSIRDSFSFQGTLLGNTLPQLHLVLYICAVALVFAGLIAVVYPRVYRKK